jgi:DNA-binding response OmpR family regulator
MPSIVFPDFARSSAFPFDSTAINAWPTLLLVDSDVELVSAIVCFFEKRGFHVGAAGSLNEAKSLFARRKSWTMVIAEFHLPDGTGWELCTWLRDQKNHTPFLLTSTTPVYAVPSKGMDYLSKPFSLDQLEARVQASAAIPQLAMTWTVQGAV